MGFRSRSGFKRIAVVVALGKCLLLYGSGFVPTSKLTCNVHFERNKGSSLSGKTHENTFFLKQHKPDHRTASDPPSYPRSRYVHLEYISDEDQAYLARSPKYLSISSLLIPILLLLTLTNPLTRPGKTPHTQPPSPPKTLQQQTP